MRDLSLLPIFKRAFGYARYHLKEKWQFVYFELNLDGPVFSLPEVDQSLVIRIAKKADVARIEADIYPHLTLNEKNDTKYIQKIGEEKFKCFIAEKEGKIVHYFLLFEDALCSPLVKTPLDKKKRTNCDAYLASTFTIPEARGLWIVPQTILKIIEYLKSTDIQRMLVLVHPETPGAIEFYQMLGFKVINNPCSKYFFASLFYGNDTASKSI